MALERKDVDKKYKWDLSVIYKDEVAFFEDYAKAEKMIKAFAAHEKTMLSGAEGLYNTLKAMTDIEAVIERLWQYASLNFSVETTNNAYQALDGRVRNLAVMAGTTSWFVSPYLLRVDQETLDKWFAEYPALETYRRTVELSVRYRKHTLSDECEQLMSKMEDFLGGNQQTRSLFANADLKFGKIRNSEGKQVELTDTNYVPFLMSQDRRVRQAAFKTLYPSIAFSMYLLCKLGLFLNCISAFSLASFTETSERIPVNFCWNFFVSRFKILLPLISISCFFCSISF